MSVRILTSVACVTAIACSTLLFAQSHPDAAKIMQDRHENYEKIGDSFKTIRDQLRGDRDVAAITGAAETINTLAPQIKTWFPEGTGPETGIETEALAKIWQDKAGFNAAADKLVTEAGNMLVAAKSGDLGQVGNNVRTLGGACKNCHDSYRVEQE
jgi:cytochrome c556